MATVPSRSAVAARCPTCSAEARKVAPLTVRSIVKPGLADRVREETYGFCPSPACEVVYFADGEPEQILRSDIRVRVGQKATEPPIPVCYCFDWTTDDIEQEILRTGTTTIPDRIKQKIRQGFCQCETMNPQGTCCLGNVNQAVNEVRAKLAATKAAGTPRDQGHAVSADMPSASVLSHASEGLGAGLAGLGALVTALAASACCWLPLILIALGFSAAGVGTLFERYQPLLLTATFSLLAFAWILSYRAPLGRLWARLTGRPIPSPAADACCARDIGNSPVTLFPFSTEQSTVASDNHACCATDPAPNSAECAAPQTVGQSPTESTAGRIPRRPISRGSFNRLMLGLATGLIVLFASFPSWSNFILGGVKANDSCCAAPSGIAASTDRATPGTDPCCALPASLSSIKEADQQPVVLELEGLTCEGCAATVGQALSQMPDVARVQVRYPESRAEIDPKPGARLSADALVKAVKEAGYRAAAVPQPSGPAAAAATLGSGRRDRPADDPSAARTRQVDPGVEPSRDK